MEPRATLSFSRSLYEAPAVHAAVAAYAALGRWQVEEHPEELRVTLDGDPELLDHLANHVLFETIRRRRPGGSS